MPVQLYNLAGGSHKTAACRGQCWCTAHVRYQEEGGHGSAGAHGTRV